MNEMKRPTEIDKRVDPYSKDIVKAITMVQQEGRTATIDAMLEGDIDPEAKQKIAKRLSHYGEVKDYEDWSRFITIQPFSLDAARRLENAYYRNRLPGVKHLEVDTMASMCGKQIY